MAALVSSSCVQCGEPSNKRCLGCTSKYCSKECQVTNWKAGHKNTCWGKRCNFLVQAIEIGLFGTNSGGSHIEQLRKIQDLLEEGNPNKEILDLSTPENQQRVVETIITSTYLPPVVEITQTCFAAFIPMIYLGSYKSRNAAHLALKQALVDKEASRLIDAPAGFIPEPIKQQKLPYLNSAEFGSIAMYHGRFDKIWVEGASSDPKPPPVLSNTPKVLPRPPEQIKGLHACMLGDNGQLALGAL